MATLALIAVPSACLTPTAPVQGGEATKLAGSAVPSVGDAAASATGEPVRLRTGNTPPAMLPVPPGSGDLPRPSGAKANLRVLPWAGFRAAVSYTFDDSQPSQIDHWAELKVEGVRMSFYVNPSNNWYAGYDTTWRDAIAQGHEIGNHTMNHCHADLSGCNHPGTMDQEIDHCSSYIAERLGQAGVWTFAAPFGDVGYQPYAAARFLVARGVSPGTVAPSDNTDPFNLPIMGASGGEPAAVFNGHIDAALAQGRWLIFLFHSILPTSQNWFAGVDITSITGSIEHAKSLGNLWIDSVVDIGAYWLGQRTFEASARASAGGKVTWRWSLPAAFPPGHVLRVGVDGGTLSQGGRPLAWNGHGYYEVALDARAVTWSRDVD